MTLAAGTRLGPYEITAKLGEGGMGEVYRATDGTLKREVAIKVLPAAFTEDEARLARFEREAQLLAQLNHPSIAHVYGLEGSGTMRALVMELVEGPTLAQRLEAGPLPLEESLPLARQIAEALEEAHGKGIVHRDLKPQNVKLSADGRVKVLDFGLAKAMDPGGASGAASAAELAASPTLTLGATVQGVILGTAAYMAPEQAKGGAVDKRADIWAFGVVLYEMLTGRRLFDAPTVPETLAEVLTRTPDLARLPAATPTALRRLLRRCLERSPKDRLHDIADARIVLDDLLSGRIAAEEPRAAPDEASGAPRGTPWAARLGWAAAGLAVGALAVLTLKPVSEPPSADPPVVRSLTYSGTSAEPSASLDGRHVAFTSSRDGTSRIWLKQLATGEEVALTDGPDTRPEIAPDSSAVLFLRAREGRTDLYRIPLVGGEARRLARDVYAAGWSPDSRRIVFLRGRGEKTLIATVSAEGGEERAVAEPEDALRGIAWSPDGLRLATVASPPVNPIAVRALMTVDVDGGDVRTWYPIPTGSSVSRPIWDGDGAVLYTWSPTQAGRGGTLLQRLELGAAAPRALYSFDSAPDTISLAGRGAVVFDDGGRRQNLFEVGPDGSLGRRLTGGPVVDRQPAFSADGSRVLFTSDRSGSLDLWSLDVASGALRRLTFDTADDWDPCWSPDGEHLIWSSNRGGHFEIWMADADGTGARQVTSDGMDAENPTMSAGGEWIVYTSGNPDKLGVWKIRPDGSEATLLLPGAYALPELAPSSGWIAALANDSQVDGVAPIKVLRLEDGSTVADLELPGEGVNVGRSRWMPDGRTLVSWGQDASGTFVLYRQPIAAGRDTSAQREIVARSEDQRAIESLGVSALDGRIVVSAGGGESDVMIVEGIPGVGASRPELER